MGDVVALSSVRRRRERWPDVEVRSSARGAIVHPFPGARLFRMVENLAAYMATLGDEAGEEFLIWHFDLEWDRLMSCGVSELEAEKYIITTARAIWSRARTIQAGAA